MSGTWDGYFWKSWATFGQGASLNVAGVLKAPSPGYVVTMRPWLQGINPRILIWISSGKNCREPGLT
jgi:hypothetical protein